MSKALYVPEAYAQRPFTLLLPYAHHCYIVSYRHEKYYVYTSYVCRMTNSPTALQPATRSLGRPSPMFYIDVETSQILRDRYTERTDKRKSIIRLLPAAEIISNTTDSTRNPIPANQANGNERSMKTKCVHIHDDRSRYGSNNNYNVEYRITQSGVAEGDSKELRRKNE